MTMTISQGGRLPVPSGGGSLRESGPRRTGSVDCPGGSRSGRACGIGASGSGDVATVDEERSGAGGGPGVHDQERDADRGSDEL